MHPSDRTKLTVTSAFLGCVLPFALWSQKTTEQWHIRKGIEATQEQSEVSSQIAFDLLTGATLHCVQGVLAAVTAKVLTYYY
jgi:hypothetical protein